MERVSAFRDFTQITLTRSVERQGVYMPQGTRGVIMASYADGSAYEVEFDEPRHVVLTLEEEEIQA